MNQSPQPTLIPTFSGPNFAPVEPILRAQDTNKRSPSKLTDALKELFQHFNKDHDRAWNSIFRIGQTVASFESGDQIPITNPFTGGTMFARPTRQDDSTKRALNQMQFYGTKCNQIWMSSDPNVTVVPGRQVDSATQAARGANALVDFYETNFYDEKFELRQAGYARTFGTYLIRYRWDMGVKGLIAVREVVENKTIKASDGSGYCGDCEMVGAAGMFQRQSMPEHDDAFPGSPQVASLPTCPRCQSLSVSIVPEQSVEVRNVVGTQQQNLGDLVCEQLPLTGCRWDLTKDAEDSSWFIYKQRVTPGQIRALLGQIKIPAAGSEGDTGLDVERMLAHSGQALGGKNDNSYGTRQRDLSKESVTLEEMWFSASNVEHIVLSGDEMGISGRLPAGRLSDHFPNGGVCVGTNGMSTIYGVYEESHKDMIVSGVYHPKVMSGAGRGAVDSVEVQRRLNTLDSQQLLYLNASATPAYVYRPEAIASEAVGYLGNPTTNIPLKDLPQGMSLEEVAKALPPGQMAPAIVQYTQEFLNNQAQMASHCTEFSGALPGVNNKTAHGAELAASLAQSLFAPMLSVKAYTRRRGAEIMVNLWRKHQPQPQYFPLAGRRNGTDGLYLKAADLNVDLLFKVEDGSEAPKTPLSRRMALNSLAQGFGNLGAYIQAKASAPKLVRPIEKLFDLDLDDDDSGDITTLCRKRVNQMQQAEKIGAQSPDDLINAIQPPISEFEVNQSDCSEWYRQLLTEDDGQQASPLMRQAFEGLVVLHAKNEAAAQAQIAQLAGQVQQAGQQPAQDAQQQAQMEQQAHQAALQSQQPQPDGAPPPDPNQQAALQAQQSQQDADQQQAQSAQQHDQQMQQMAAQQTHERSMVAAKHGHEAIKQAADHAAKERLAEMAAKAAKHKAHSGVKK